MSKFLLTRRLTYQVIYLVFSNKLTSKKMYRDFDPSYQLLEFTSTVRIMNISRLTNNFHLALLPRNHHLKLLMFY